MSVRSAVGSVWRHAQPGRNAVHIRARLADLLGNASRGRYDRMKKLEEEKWRVVLHVVAALTRHLRAAHAPAYLYLHTYTFTSLAQGYAAKRKRLVGKGF